MDLEVTGRHALLFDDDSMAAFVNSKEALVEWNSLLIDRYDVRHLLSSPPPPRSKRRHTNLDDDDVVLGPQLDQERYLDLPPDSPSPSLTDQQDLDNATESANTCGYHSVGFTYGNNGEPVDQKDSDSSSEFRPSFPVPEALLQNLPPNEKVHQIIARTATFVSKHGGQSEIILRVKQGDNPTFGFLMPDHRLHAYFRFLVDHQELLADKSPEEDNKTEGGPGQAGDIKGGGALSLLGSIYGTAEDEDTKTEAAVDVKRNVSAEAADAYIRADSSGSEGPECSKNSPVKKETGFKHPPSSLKDKASLVKRNPSVSTTGVGNASKTKKECDKRETFSGPTDKSKSSVLAGTPQIEPPIIEPTTELKRVIDKIVEFILRNGKEFEAVLAEQDVKHGRFPFLLPTNLYHPYYRKVLQKAEEAKVSGKEITTEKHENSSTYWGTNDSPSIGSDIPDDFNKKEKFKMVIGKPKKDGPEQLPAKPSQPEVGISVDAAAAILQAARRGIRNPDLQSFPGSENAQNSSNDSCEAGLTREQKLKAERLKRAKMFVAMIKSGAVPLKTEPSRSESVEPTDSGLSGSGTTDVGHIMKEREGSSVSLDAGMESERTKTGDDHSRKWSKRKYRSRSESEKVGDEEEEAEEEEKEKDTGGERNHKRSKRRHSHHRSSHHSREKDKRRRKDSSSKDRGFRDRHEHETSSGGDDDHWQSHHRRIKSSSRHKSNDNDSSSDSEHPADNSGSRKHKHDDESSADEHRHQRRSRKHKRPRSKRESESKSKKSRASQSRDASELLKSCPDVKAPSQPNHSGEVSEDLRAKVRAMLMATL